jgi:hypothetical protein
MTVAARPKVFVGSNNGVVGSNPTRGMDVCARLFCIYVVLCVGSGLATGWSPVQGALPTVYWLRNWRKAKIHKDCRAIDRQIDGWIGWMDGWMDGWVDGWVGGWVYRQTERRIKGLKDRWVDGWMDGWMDGWTDRQINRHKRVKVLRLLRSTYVS